MTALNFMFLYQLLKPIVLSALLMLSILPSVGAAEEPATCDTGSEECLASCKRFKEGDARLSACHNFCRTKSKDCSHAIAIEAIAIEPTAIEPLCTEACEARSDALPLETATSVPTVNATKPAPQVDPLPYKKAMLKELEKNTEMLAAIRTGNLTSIRRLVEIQGLSPTYVHGYEYNPQTRKFDGRVVRLRLSDIFNDSNTLRSDAVGQDRILALFLDLGMDVKATLATAVPTDSKHGDANTITQVARTAWGPSLRMMEAARDSGARFRAFEIALQQGLVPNDDFGEWLFAELPQVCGRDRSKFAIQVVDLLIKYLGPSLQDRLWREGEHGPETLSDVLDRSFAPSQPKTPSEKAQFALQDAMWEQCALLSRRINRFLAQGN